ncbi:MAG: peptidylprolyl isomerase [Planctomycetota bacterium]|jgi:cyclophilin family peptidyl-prolyl cis-trans isomerase
MHLTRIKRMLLVSLAFLPALAASAQDTRPAMPPPAKPAETKPQEKLAFVVMATSMGDIVLELDRRKAPITTKNFLAYTDSKFYDGTIFHRVIADFMIQGGGLEPGLIKKQTGPPIVNESHNGLSNLRGTIAMARRNAPDSATSQFFINVVDNLRLDPPSPDRAGYTVFGRVVAGMDVVEAIRYVPTGSRDVPIETVLIKQVRRLSPEDAKKRIEAEKKGSAAKPAG